MRSEQTDERGETPKPVRAYAEVSQDGGEEPIAALADEPAAATIKGFVETMAEAVAVVAVVAATEAPVETTPEAANEEPAAAASNETPAETTTEAAVEEPAAVVVTEAPAVTTTEAANEEPAAAASNETPAETTTKAAVEEPAAVVVTEAPAETTTEASTEESAVVAATEAPAETTTEAAAAAAAAAAEKPAATTEAPIETTMEDAVEEPAAAATEAPVETTTEAAVEEPAAAAATKAPAEMTTEAAVEEPVAATEAPAETTTEAAVEEPAVVVDGEAPAETTTEAAVEELVAVTATEAPAETTTEAAVEEPAVVVDGEAPAEMIIEAAVEEPTAATEAPAETTTEAAAEEPAAVATEVPAETTTEAAAAAAAAAAEEPAILATTEAPAETKTGAADKSAPDIADIAGIYGNDTAAAAAAAAGNSIDEDGVSAWTSASKSDIVVPTAPTTEVDADPNDASISSNNAIATEKSIDENIVVAPTDIAGVVRCSDDVAAGNSIDEGGASASAGAFKGDIAETIVSTTEVDDDSNDANTSSSDTIALEKSTYKASSRISNLLLADDREEWEKAIDGDGSQSGFAEAKALAESHAVVGGGGGHMKNTKSLSAGLARVGDEPAEPVSGVEGDAEVDLAAAKEAVAAAKAEVEKVLADSESSPEAQAAAIIELASKVATEAALVGPAVEQAVEQAALIDLSKVPSEEPAVEDAAESSAKDDTTTQKASSRISVLLLADDREEWEKALDGDGSQWFAETKALADAHAAVGGGGHVKNTKSLSAGLARVGDEPAEPVSGVKGDAEVDLAAAKEAVGAAKAEVEKVLADSESSPEAQAAAIIELASKVATEAALVGPAVEQAVKQAALIDLSKVPSEEPAVEDAAESAAKDDTTTQKAPSRISVLLLADDREEWEKALDGDGSQSGFAETKALADAHAAVGGGGGHVKNTKALCAGLARVGDEPAEPVSGVEGDAEVDLAAAKEAVAAAKVEVESVLADPESSLVAQAAAIIELASKVATEAALVGQAVEQAVEQAALIDLSKVPSEEPAVEDAAESAAKDDTTTQKASSRISVLLLADDREEWEKALDGDGSQSGFAEAKALADAHAADRGVGGHVKNTKSLSAGLARVGDEPAEPFSGVEGDAEVDLAAAKEAVASAKAEVEKFLADSESSPEAQAAAISELASKVATEAALAGPAVEQAVEQAFEQAVEQAALTGLLKLLSEEPAVEDAAEPAAKSDTITQKSSSRISVLLLADDPEEWEEAIDGDGSQSGFAEAKALADAHAAVGGGGGHVQNTKSLSAGLARVGDEPAEPVSGVEGDAKVDSAAANQAVTADKAEVEKVLADSESSPEAQAAAISELASKVATEAALVGPAVEQAVEQAALIDLSKVPSEEPAVEDAAESAAKDDTTMQKALSRISVLLLADDREEWEKALDGNGSQSGFAEAKALAESHVVVGGGGGHVKITKALCAGLARVDDEPAEPFSGVEGDAEIDLAAAKEAVTAAKVEVEKVLADSESSLVAQAAAIIELASKVATEAALVGPAVEQAALTLADAVSIDNDEDVKVDAEVPVEETFSEECVIVSEDPPLRMQSTPVEDIIAAPEMGGFVSDFVDSSDRDQFAIANSGDQDALILSSEATLCDQISSVFKMNNVGVELEGVFEIEASAGESGFAFNDAETSTPARIEVAPKAGNSGGTSDGVISKLFSPPSAPPSTPLEVLAEELKTVSTTEKELPKDHQDYIESEAFTFEVKNRMRCLVPCSVKDGGSARSGDSSAIWVALIHCLPMVRMLVVDSGPDDNGDGTSTADEVPLEDDARCLELLNYFDKDCDGYLSESEFAQLLRFAYVLAFAESDSVVSGEDGGHNSVDGDLLSVGSGSQVALGQLFDSIAGEKQSPTKKRDGQRKKEQEGQGEDADDDLGSVSSIESEDTDVAAVAAFSGPSFVSPRRGTRAKISADPNAPAPAWAVAAASRAAWSAGKRVGKLETSIGGLHVALKSEAAAKNAVMAELESTRAQLRNTNEEMEAMRRDLAALRAHVMPPK